MLKYLFIAVPAFALFLYPAAARADDTDLQQLMRDARTGSSSAQYMLGMKYLEGDGVAQDSAEANKWLSEAASREHQEAVKMLADMPLDNVKDVPLLRGLANSGNPYAQFRLGEIYANGDGVDQDLVEAYKWFALAAIQLPTGEAQKNSIIKRVEVASWLTEDELFQGKQRVADWHSDNSSRSGIESAQSDENAFRKYTIAARRGDAEVQHHLANMLLEGRGYQKDEKLAAQWMMQAAMQGYAEAQFSLAKMYFYGTGVERDVAEAYKWVLFAIRPREQGARPPKGAIQLKGKMEYQMPVKQIREIEKRVSALPTSQ